MSAQVSTALPNLLTPEKLQRATPALDPKYLRTWFSSLPVTNTTATAQELYRVLCNLNRLPMAARVRLELLELSASPVASVIAGLQVHFGSVSLPLSAKKRQLADFLRLFQDEMAYGYKTVIQDMHASSAWQKHRETMALAVERAIRHLALSLLRSYQVYVPHPAGIWREIHGLYRYAEANDGQAEPVPFASDGAAQTSVRKSYLQAVLLGLCGPYQLPPNECSQVYAFLTHWADKAVISQTLEVTDTTRHFLIDLSADLPPVLFPGDVKALTAPQLRDLSTIELARGVHVLVGRLQKGESPSTLNLGMDCIDSACIDILQRMVKFWGANLRRKFSRRAKKDTQLSVCAGLKALHFFSDGQRSFAPPVPVGLAIEAMPEIDMQGHQTRNFNNTEDLKSSATDESFRIERWWVRNESAAGLSLLHLGEESVAVRVGDLLGFYNDEIRSWRVGLTRWLKNPELTKLEMGVEMIAPSARPVAVRPHTSDNKGTSEYSQALLLPAVEILRQPTSLIVARGAFQAGQDLWLTDGHGESRRVHPLAVIERSASFEQFAFADAGVS